MKTDFLELRISTAGEQQHLIFAAHQAIRVGRDPECQVVIDDPSIAPRQAELRWNGDGALSLEPLASFVSLQASGRLLLEGRSVHPPITLRDSETLTLGPTTLTWRALSEEESPTMTSALPAGASQSLATVELTSELEEGRYLSGEEIGHGGMGKVLAAVEKSLQRTVALKVLRRSEDQAGQFRFIREARITGRLQHPSIVPVHELNVDEEGRVFYTMKLVKGVTLRQILRDLNAGEPGALQSYDLPSLLTIFQKVCDAVAFAHSQSPAVIHRDLKPDNIMVGDYGEVLVMDWGAAKILQRDELESPAVAPHRLRPPVQASPNESNSEHAADPLLTQAGSVMGTPGYMAPEQVIGRAASADERTDIYALGAILYALLTLETPPRSTPQQVLEFLESDEHSNATARAWLEHAAPLLADHSARPKLQHLPHRLIPESLTAVALKAMALLPFNRFASVKELQADVAAFQGGFATSGRSSRRVETFPAFGRASQAIVRRSRCDDCNLAHRHSRQFPATPGRRRQQSQLARHPATRQPG